MSIATKFLCYVFVSVLLPSDLSLRCISCGLMFISVIAFFVLVTYTPDLFDVFSFQAMSKSIDHMLLNLLQLISCSSFRLLGDEFSN